MVEKISKQKAIVAKMIRLYCSGHDHHANGSELCSECAELLEYAHERLDKCRFGESKPQCRKCTVHCYRPQMRSRMRMVMRYSGMRMIFYAPLTALKHLF